jgi:hypothetical protein
LREGDRLIRDGQEWLIGPVLPRYAEPEPAGTCPLCGGSGVGGAADRMDEVIG